MFFDFVLVCALLGLVKGELILPREPSVDKKSAIDTYIVGGAEATKHLFPYQVALYTEGSIPFCSGSLISANFVLTTASCVEGSRQILVLLGAHNLTQSEPSQVVIPSTFFIRHHAWNDTTNTNNIAVVKLSHPVNLTAEIEPIYLPAATAKDPVKANLTGWGKMSDSSNRTHNTLQHVELNVMDNAYCDPVMDYITTYHMCTNGKGKKGACNGDLGAPLVSGGFQFGFVSVINPVCEVNLPTVYTRIIPYLTWIKANSDVQ